MSNIYGYRGSNYMIYDVQPSWVKAERYEYCEPYFAKDRENGSVKSLFRSLKSRLGR